VTRVAVLVTRPATDNERTAQALRARGYDVLLAPVLKAERLTVSLDDLDAISGTVVTSTNALRAMADHPMLHKLRPKPLFAVGERTATEARALQFSDVRAAEGHVSALTELIGRQPAEEIKALLYLAGEEVSRDIAPNLAAKGIAVITRKAYRMVRVAPWPEQTVQTIQQRGLDAVLHYSRRSALIFVEFVRAQGLDASALAAPQCCLSQGVADVLSEAGAGAVFVAALPNEQSLLEALDHARGRVQGS
jgi:uroporphyrinogen-III synthase